MGRGEWVVADLDGLAKTLARRGKSFVVGELYRNALDEDVSSVRMTFGPVPGRRAYEFVIRDDSPTGFRDLAQAWTMFAESYKKADPTKAGRFNIGEKFTLALCDEAEIASTTGTVYFTPKGRRVSKAKTDRGTVVKAILRMTREEAAEIETYVDQLLVPTGVTVTFNGRQLMPRRVHTSVKATLQTEVAGPDGVLRRTPRVTTVEILEPIMDEPAMLYELGVPVMELDDRFHVNVGQKVPLTLERDSVPPAYLRAVRTVVLNATFAALTKDDVTDVWVREAAGAKDAAPEAVERVMTLRFGEKRVTYDPSDPEANHLAVAKGYTVVPGAALTAGEWKNAKTAGSILPAGKVTPSPKPFSADGEPLKMLEHLKPEHLRFAAYVDRLHKILIGSGCETRFTDDRGWKFAAAYGKRGTNWAGDARGDLTINVSDKPKDWFDKPSADWWELLIHEFAHAISSNHLSSEYHGALCELGSRLTGLALSNPKFVSANAVVAASPD